MRGDLWDLIMVIHSYDRWCVFHFLPMMRDGVHLHFTTQFEPQILEVEENKDPNQSSEHERHISMV